MFWGEYIIIDELKSKRKNVFNYAISNENKDICNFNVLKGVKEYNYVLDKHIEYNQYYKLNE